MNPLAFHEDNSSPMEFRFFLTRTKNMEYNCNTVLIAVDTQFTTIYCSCKKFMPTSILSGQFDKNELYRYM